MLVINLLSWENTGARRDVDKQNRENILYQMYWNRMNIEIGQSDD